MLSFVFFFFFFFLNYRLFLAELLEYFFLIKKLTLCPKLSRTFFSRIRRIQGLEKLNWIKEISKLGVAKENFVRKKSFFPLSPF